MREILFRGKRLNNGKWVLGHYFANDNGTFIFAWPRHANFLGEDVMVQVDPETVGQYTGVDDKNGKHIFDGDVIIHHYGKNDKSLQVVGVVCWDEKECEFMLRNIYNGKAYGLCQKCLYEVIGNIHDKPESTGGTP